MYLTFMLSMDTQTLWFLRFLVCVGFWQDFFYPDIKKKVAQKQKKLRNPREHSVPSENIGRCVGKSILLNPHIFVLGGFG